MIVQSTAQPTGGEGPFNQVMSKTITAEICFFTHYIDDDDLYLHRAA